MLGLLVPHIWVDLCGSYIEGWRDWKYGSSEFHFRSMYSLNLIYLRCIPIFHLGTLLVTDRKKNKDSIQRWANFECRTGSCGNSWGVVSMKEVDWSKVGPSGSQRAGLQEQYIVYFQVKIHHNVMPPVSVTPTIC